MLSSPTVVPRCAKCARLAAVKNIGENHQAGNFMAYEQAWIGATLPCSESATIADSIKRGASVRHAVDEASSTKKRAPL